MGETVPLKVITDGEIMNENSFKTESKRRHEFVEDDAEMEASPSKKSSKGGLNDESNSEVFNPNISLLEDGASSETVSSQIADRSSKSAHKENLSTSAWKINAGFTDNNEQCIDDSAAVVPMKSEVVLEAPKSVGTGGIRRIILKFSKSKGTVNSMVCPSTIKVDTGMSYNHFHTECMMKPLESADSRANVLLGTLGREKQILCGPTRRTELKMPNKVLPNSYLSSVKKLLSTGILEGLPVKYIEQERELLRGVIRDIGYLCGCSLCNFCRVVNAFEFEQHAGCKTRHPNNHIFLDNGKSVYSVVQELRNIPLSSLDGEIQTVIGGPVNEKSYLVWKESFEISQSASHDDDEEENGIGKHPHQWNHQSSRYHSKAMDKASSFSVQKSHVKQKNCRMHKAYKEKGVVSKKLHADAFNLVPIQRSVNSDKARKRDNDLHRLLFMPNGLPDRAELAYYSKGKRLLKGYKQGNGIVCSCCNSVISPSTFEAHAGWATRRQPYRHIYTSDGVSLHDLSISLASGRNLTGGNRNDTCTVCDDGGDIIFCSRCPRAFHAGCLELRCTPEGGWNCPYCKDKIELGGKLLNESSGRIRRITIRLTRIVRDPESEIGGCAVCRDHDFSVSNFDARTVMLCDQCEKEYHVGCLRNHGLCDLKELPKGKWFCCDDCSRIHAALQKLFLCGARVIPPSLFSTINRKLIEKGMTEELGNDVQWQLLSGKVGSLCDRSLLSRAAAIFRECFDPIVERSGRDLIPAMVYGTGAVQLARFLPSYDGVAFVLMVGFDLGFLLPFVVSQWQYFPNEILCVDVFDETTLMDEPRFILGFLHPWVAYTNLERNVAGQEFGGMYCAILCIKSVVVSAGVLRIFGREVAELPLVATARQSRGKPPYQRGYVSKITFRYPCCQAYCSLRTAPHFSALKIEQFPKFNRNPPFHSQALPTPMLDPGYFQVLFSCIERLLWSLNVEKIVLPAAEDAVSMWTNKFGFGKMTHENSKYTKNLQLMTFKGTSMLEKEVPQITEEHAPWL
ncbi:hypothetical protein Sjap_013128 [Stephania japonica]|uniref:PHD-type domain-containing protein n=1 Tax=Stephania japonica TaxID=461633 RepID=A0AAP0IZT0_9MAGN